MAKAWMITIEPTDKSREKRFVEAVSGRKKIAQIEAYLCELYEQMVPKFEGKLQDSITRDSGILTTLDKAPFVLIAELKEDN